MALSLKNDTFTSLGSFKNKVLSDDYTHSVFETHKLKGQNTIGTKVEYKFKLKTTKQRDLVQAQLDDEGKVQFSLNNYVVELGARRNQDFRVHVDLGERQLNGKPFNFFTNLKTNAKLDSFRLRFGTNHFHSNYETNTRLEYVSNNSSVGFVQRNFFRRNNNVLAYVLQLNNAVPGYITAFDSILGYESNKYDLYLQYNTKGIQRGKASLHLNRHLNNQSSLGAEVVNDKDDWGLTVGFKHSVNKNLTVRAKLDNQMRVALAGKYNWNQVSLTSSLQLNLGKDDQVFKCDNFPPLPLGFKFDIKI